MCHTAHGLYLATLPASNFNKPQRKAYVTKTLVPPMHLHLMCTDSHRSPRSTRRATAACFQRR